MEAGQRARLIAVFAVVLLGGGALFATQSQLRSLGAPVPLRLSAASPAEPSAPEPAPQAAAAAPETGGADQGGRRP
ncbi:hypothetical protein [Rhodobacter viridis]|uniref:hypothetical protein n=1 Tax=Rhodobacter viridis TaxID=1054202 RepID=UPI000DA26767|nr:hypothetical protein [Rhodobacter viridis]